ncbi:MAG: UDP-N-acetylmuramoyl-L-alanine--D-glutamate ligase [Tepidimonas sp.]|nr:UDP-N-acetylmuramoyl-L-alanine--D-glutamate ligase [Tepidimonas sp.]
MTAWSHDLLPLLRGRPVLVLGLGTSGLALARWLHAAAAQVTVADTRAQPPQAEALHQAAPGATLLAGVALDEALWQRAPWALVARSPGLSPAQWAALRAAAQAAGVPFVGELELWSGALKALQERGQPPAVVLAITGTNGKTTTTALTGHLLRSLGWDVAVAGNIGPTLLDTLAERLQSGALPRAWVLELSSFQLEGVEGFEPTAAAVLNVTQDHLDWHGTLQAYAAAKARIFGQGGVMVLNRDDPIVWGWRPLPVQDQAPGTRRRRERTRPWTSFGLGLPSRPGDWGLETQAGVTWLVRAHPEAEPQDGAPLPLQRLMPAEALRIQGRHNAANALAALALASAAGAPLAPLLHALRDYRGEPHRVQSVAIVREVEYIDDSKGTNVGATLAALQGLGAQRRLVVILGGDGKGQDFAPLAPAVARHARAVALIGRDAPVIEAALAATGVPCQRLPDLPAAVRWCAQQARPGDAVLLSPACASLDMFRDYAHRAAVFVEAVRALQDEEGTPA